MTNTIDDYHVLEIIGKGSFGTCYKVQRISSKHIYVWKEINYRFMSEENKEQLVSEVNLLGQLNHPNIVRYFDRIIHKPSFTLYLIMEWCQGGDLETLIKKCKRNKLYLEEQFIWKILYQISRALYACHFHTSQKAILHRDIKPANILLDNKGNAKLGDFGLATILDIRSNFAASLVGTPNYMSPELLNGEKYNKKSDIWSLGCVIYEICALHPPFLADNIKELISAINLGRISRIPPNYSEDLNTIILSLLKGNIEERPSIDSILNHPLIISRMISETLSTLKLNNIEIKKNLHKKENIPLNFDKEELRLRFETLKRREEAIQLREKALTAREKALTQREKYLASNFSQNKIDIETKEYTKSMPEKHVRFNIGKLSSQKENSIIGIIDCKHKNLSSSMKANNINSKLLIDVSNKKKENIILNFKEKGFIKSSDIKKVDRKYKYEFRLI